MPALPDLSAHGLPVFDVHHHAGSIDGYFGSAGPSDAGDPAVVMQRDIEARLRFMDAWGIEHALLMPASGQATTNGLDDIRRANDAVATYRACRPDRFPVAVGTVLPQDGEHAAREAERCLHELGMGGLVWHHRFQGCPINHPGMHALLRVLAAAGRPAMVHVIAESTLESPWRLEVLADEHPDVRFVALDAFSSPHQASWMQYIAGRHDNLWFDTGVLASAGHALEAFIARHGPGKLLFGSDYYSSPRVLNTPFALLELLAAEIDDTARRQILAGNARALFNVPG